MTDRMHEMREVAAMPLAASPEPPDRVWFYWGRVWIGLRRCHDELLAHHAPDQVVVVDDSAVGHHSERPGTSTDRIGDNRTRYSDALRLW